MSSVTSADFVPSQLSLLIKELRSSPPPSEGARTDAASASHPRPVADGKADGAGRTVPHAPAGGRIEETRATLLDLQARPGDAVDGFAAGQSALGSYGTVDTPGAAPSLIAKA